MFKRVHPYILVVLAVGIHFGLINEYDGPTFVNGMGLLLLSVLYAATFTYTIYKVVKDKRPIPFLKKVTPLWMAIVLAFSFPVTYWLVQTDGGKKVAIHAGCYSDLTFISLDLRTDNTFKLLNSGPFGGTYFRGKYLLEKDTLRIYNDSLKYLYPTGTFAMTTDSLQRRFFEYVPANKTEKAVVPYSRLGIGTSRIQ